MLDSRACGLGQHERGKDSPVSETAEKRAGRGGAEAAECDSGPRDDQAAHSITAVGGGNVRGAVCCKSRTDPG